MGPASTVKVLSSLGFRQTLEATKITAVGEADTQVAQDASVGVNQQVRPGHLGGGLVAAGLLVAGGITRTLPSAVTSTLSS